METKNEDLTQAEIDALNDPEGGLSPDDTVPVADDSELDGGEKKPDDAGAGGNDGETDEQKAARLAADADAAADDGKNNDGQPPAPLLVAQVPADTEAQLTAIKTQKADLAQKFDDGELSAKDYQLKLDELNGQERQIELLLHKAQIAQDMSAQQARNAFLSEVKTFTEEVNPLYKQSAVAWKALDEAVKKVGNDPENASLTGKQILEKAHAEVMKDPVLSAAFGQQSTARKPGKQDAKTGEAPPPTIGRLPAAESVDTNGDKFANLDRLQAIAPMKYEEAVGKLSPADLEAYLSS